MQVSTSLLIRAPSERIFDLAADIQRWPTILPHYRWVRLLSTSPDGLVRVADMAARRGAIPVRWHARQYLLPQQQRIEFRHVGGITRGMDVAWVLTPVPGGVLVRIDHAFSPEWPLVPDALVTAVVGHFFVDSIARRTLDCIKRLAEAAPAAPRSAA